MAKVEFSRYFAAEIRLAANVLEEAFRRQAAEQGHIDTAKLDRSFRHVIDDEAFGFTINFFAAEHVFVVDTGIPAKNVPYGGRRARHSKFIEALENWLIRKGDADPLGGAFRISEAAKAGKGIMQRKGFIGETVNLNKDKINTRLEEAFGRTLDQSLNEIMTAFNKLNYK